MEDKVLVTRTADEETEDGRIKNREAMAKIRDAWVYKQVRARLNEFTNYRQVRMYKKLHEAVSTVVHWFLRSFVFTVIVVLALLTQSELTHASYCLPFPAAVFVGTSASSL
jgi:hypothetical protein